MKKFLFVVCLIAALFSFAVLSHNQAYSDELDDISKKINELQDALSSSKKATAPLESQLNNLKTRLTGIENQVAFIENDIKEKKKIIDTGYLELGEQTEIFNKAVREYYIKTYFFNPLLIFVASNDAASLTRILAYHKKSTDQDKALITNIALKISDLEKRKKTLEEEEQKLGSVKVLLASEKADVEKVVKGAKDYQSTLSSEIAQLSAKQQSLLAQKLGSLNLPSSLGAGPLYCTDDRELNPGFGSAFAFFTFGIPHRVGMNQYGADGRAKAGQSHEDILRAYFNNISFENKSSRIKVQGYGEMDLEEYMLGIYEMPNSFHIEALKAQAVAARSYALSYTNNGEKEICTTQACQVYKGGNKGGAWEQAVHDTAGKVIISEGQVATAWYASTAGGYLFTNNDVWGGSQKPWTKRLRDTDGDVASFEDLINKSYDKESPCLYAAQGYRSEFAKSAWLKSEEVADIVNVLQLAKKDSSTQSHLSQVDKPNPDGTDTWDANRVKQELQSRGGSVFSTISSASIDWDKGVGKTNSITFSGDGGSISFDGSEFKNYFNLRAPANIQIVGPLYNVERK